jgi:hypothetical protein
MTDNREFIRREMELRSTPELISILRNRDEAEWRPEVFEVLADILAGRGISPPEITALGPEGIDLVESQQLVTGGEKDTHVPPDGALRFHAALQEAYPAEAANVQVDVIPWMGHLDARNHQLW